MIRLALQQRHHAGAADAFAAGGIDDDALARQDIDDGNAHGDLHYLARAGQLHFEGAIATACTFRRSSRGHRCGEVFQVDGILAAAGCGTLDHRIHEGGGAAGVDVGFPAAGFQAGRQVMLHLRRHDRVVETHLRGEGRVFQQVGKGRMFARAHEVMQRERFLFGHRR